MLTFRALLLPALLLLRAADAQPTESRSFSVDQTIQANELPEEGYPDSDGVRRFMCPAGFFRLRRDCYYLSGGTANWREAHFQCTARNATLAVLNRNGKDKMLRNYLKGDQFRKLERWIGGIYNWRQKSWDWGVTGDKVLFSNFGTLDAPLNSQNLGMSCIVLDPRQHYKWTARSCIERKYFICEAPAGRIMKTRRRKNITDPLAPQNQRLRPSSKDELRRKAERRHKNKKIRSMRKNNWHRVEDIWMHGIEPGFHPPRRLRRPRFGHKSNRTRGAHRTGRPRLGPRPEPRVAQATPSPGASSDTGAFPADGRIQTTDEHLQSLGGYSVGELAFPRLGNDFAREEILLKL